MAHYIKRLGISWFADVITSSFRPNGGRKAKDIIFSSFLPSKVSLAIRLGVIIVQPKCFIREATFTYQKYDLSFPKVCHSFILYVIDSSFIKLLQSSVYCVGKERSTTTASGRSSENVSTTSSYSSHFMAFLSHSALFINTPPVRSESIVRTKTLK